MNDLSDKVIAAKTALMVALGDKSTKYLSNLKLWFRQKCSKEDFDFESRKLLTPDKIYLHNMFFIAILNKIDAFTMPILGQPTAGITLSVGSLGNSRNSRRKRTRGLNDRFSFEPFDPLDFTAADSMEIIQPAAGTDANVQMLPTQRYCVQELFLPDVGFIHGRFLIGAWEAGLVNVDDNVAEYMAMAVQVFLKNIISAIAMNRKHYKTTGEGSFYYDIGAPLKDPSLRNTVTRQKVDDGPLELDKEITSPNFMRRSNDEGIFLSACEEIEPQEKHVVTLRELRLALKDRNLVPSHSVYSINMERITQMMH